MVLAAVGMISDVLKKWRSPTPQPKLKIESLPTGRLTRTVRIKGRTGSAEEVWLDPGTAVYEYLGPLYGAPVTLGLVAVTLKPNEKPFYIIPDNAIDWSEMKNVGIKPAEKTQRVTTTPITWDDPSAKP